MRILPRFSGISPEATVSATCESIPVSSRKLQAGTRRGDEGSASDTRRCFSGEFGVDTEVEDDAGKGALNENVEAEGSFGLGLGIPISAVDKSAAVVPCGGGMTTG